MESSKSPESVRGGLVQCAECGNAFPREEVLVFGEHNICAGCKPAFQQKLAEGSFRPRNQMQYSSVRRRFAAVTIDGFISYLISIVWMLIIAGSFTGEGNVQGSLIATAASTAFGVAYYVYFMGRFGATPGKMVLGIKVVRASGSEIGYGLALGRYFAQFLSAFSFGIGYLMAIWDDEKRSLHDRVCGSRVIHK